MGWMKRSLETIEEAAEDVGVVYDELSYDELAGRYLALKRLLTTGDATDLSVYYFALKEALRRPANYSLEREPDDDGILRGFDAEIEEQTSPDS